MVDYQRVDLQKLNQEELQDFQALLSEKTISLLAQSSIHLENYPVAIAARINAKIIGVILAIFYPHNRAAQVHDWKVQIPFRGQGIGFNLFEHLQKTLISQDKCRAIGFDYDSMLPEALIIEKILSKLHWPPPRLYLLRCHFDALTFFPPWTKISYPLPPSIEIFPWKELPIEEKKMILHWVDQGRVLPYLNPFQEENTIEYLNSLGMRYKGELIGWNITHRVDPSTIQYSNLYFEREFRVMGYAMSLLIESFRLHREHKEVITKAIFDVNKEQTEPSWWRFVEKRLVPYTVKVERFKHAFGGFLI